jgi:methylthioribose-1-phosphate isomerase
VSGAPKSRGPASTLKTGLAHAHPDPISGARYSAVELMPGDGAVLCMDQRKLPVDERYELLVSVPEVADAIKKLKVRGAPAIGITAAYGMVLASRDAPTEPGAFLAAMDGARAELAATRPTAVNLVWGLERMMRVTRELAGEPAATRTSKLAAEARAIHREDVAACRRMGALGAARIADGATVLTHCNAGALATGGYGSGLGVIRGLRDAGKRVRVIASETRPVLQGARLTAWELARDGFDVTVVTDNMVAQLFARGVVNAVVVGADRIARNGDVANKIGTYGVACLAHLHGVPFYVAAPWSTVDLACPDGAHIPIEERSLEEVLTFPTRAGSVPIAPEGVRAMNPAFDVTPARMIAAIFTERGVVSPVGDASLAALGDTTKSP